MSKTFSPKLFLLFIPILIGLIYSQSTDYNYLINYDDDVLIFNNQYVLNLNMESLVGMFTNFIEGLYHPITTLSWALDWKIGGGDPFVFHLTNILFHIMNSFLVYFFVRKINSNTFLPIIAALLFAVHPMSVENVAWLSSRKDLCYAFFFLLGLIVYAKRNHQESSILNYGLSLVFFLLALFSKSAAVTFPIVLLIIDYYQDRKLSFKTIIEKVPFFALSILFGIINIKAQQSIDFIQSMQEYSIFERISMVSYSILFYPLKSLLPLEQSAKYFYPLHGQLEWIYFAAPFALMAVVAAIFFLGRKNKLLIFSSLFYLVNILLIVKIIPTGNDIVNERYAYIANIGLFLLIGQFIVTLSTKINAKKVGPMIGGISFILLSFYSMKAYNRVEVWESSEKLWTDVIFNYPKEAIPYNERGQALYLNNNYDAAFLDLNKALEINPSLDLAYTNRGNIYLNRNEAQKALEDYNKALEFKGADALILANRGMANANLGNIEAALSDFDESLKLDSLNAEAYNGRAIAKAQTENYEGAIVDFSKSLKIKPNQHSVYKNRALAHFYLKEYEKGIADMDRTQELEPMEDRKYVIYKGRQLTNIGAFDYALKHFDDAIKANPKNAEALYYRADAKLGLKDTQGAIEDYLKVIEIVPQNASAHNNLANVYWSIGDKEKACLSWQTATGLGSKAAANALESKCD